VSVGYTLPDNLLCLTLHLKQFWITLMKLDALVCRSNSHHRFAYGNNGEIVLKIEIRGSAVGIASGYWLNDRRVVV
jgi:hypothetical protein